MDGIAMARAYVRRAEAREAERLTRYETLRAQAREMAILLREAFGEAVTVHLFGSLLDLSCFRRDSDIDLAVEGLTPEDFWKAIALVESSERGARVDVVRLESAPASLREAVRMRGERLP